MPQSRTPKTDAEAVYSRLDAASSCRSLLDQEDKQLKAEEAAAAKREKEERRSASRLAASATDPTRAPTKSSGMFIPGRENSVDHRTPSDTTISEEGKSRPPATDSASQGPSLVKPVVKRPAVTVTDEEFAKIFQDMEDAKSARDSHW